MPDLQAGQEPEGTETPTPEQQAAEAAEAAAAAAAEAEAQAAGSAGASTEEPAGNGSTPDGEQNGDPQDWKAKQEASANREAAKYRVQLREAQTQLEERDKTISELQAEVASLKGVATSKTRDAVAAAFSLPKALADVLTGDTEEELRAHAEELAQFAGGPTRTHFRSSEGVGGLDPFEGRETDDVSSAVAAARAQRY